MNSSNKKILSTILFIGLMMPLGLYADCYDQWLSSYNVAANEHTSDTQRCSSFKKSRSIELCQREADLAFSTAIEQASDTYITCIEK